MLAEAANQISSLWNKLYLECKDPWVIVGFLGQAVFTARFLVQWIVSEKHKRSIIPIEFWFLSIAGSLVTLTYAMHKSDPVFTLAYSFNCVIYIRNLTLIRREKRAAT